MNSSQILSIRFSLAFLWIFTAITSAYLNPTIGLDILTKAGFNLQSANWLMYSASFVDLCIGIWLLSNQFQKRCCEFQVATILLFTTLISFIDATYWLHPFAPIVKNFPIIILILIYRSHIIAQSEVNKIK